MAGEVSKLCSFTIHKECCTRVHWFVICGVCTEFACHGSSSTCPSSAAGCWGPRRRWGRWSGGTPAPSVRGAEPERSKPRKGFPAPAAPTPCRGHRVQRAWGQSQIASWRSPTSPLWQTDLGWPRSLTWQELEERGGRRWDKRSCGGEIAVVVSPSLPESHLWCSADVSQWWRGAADGPGCRGHSGHGSGRSHWSSEEPARLSLRS